MSFRGRRLRLNFSWRRGCVHAASSGRVCFLSSSNKHNLPRHRAKVCRDLWSGDRRLLSIQNITAVCFDSVIQMVWDTTMTTEKIFWTMWCCSQVCALFVCVCVCVCVLLCVGWWEPECVIVSKVISPPHDFSLSLSALLLRHNMTSSPRGNKGTILDNNDLPLTRHWETERHRLKSPQVRKMPRTNWADLAKVQHIQLSAQTKTQAHFPVHVDTMRQYVEVNKMEIEPSRKNWLDALWSAEWNKSAGCARLAAAGRQFSLSREKWRVIFNPSAPDVLPDDFKKTHGRRCWSPTRQRPPRNHRKLILVPTASDDDRQMVRPISCPIFGGKAPPLSKLCLATSL